MDYKDFDEYQKLTKKSAVYPGGKHSYLVPVLGLSGEAGEVADKVKKLIRDDDSKITDEKRREIAKELGDVLWYLSQISAEFGFKFSEVVKMNIEKFTSRSLRGKIGGSGDNR